VTDNDGAQSFSQLSLSVANRAPTVDIAAPATSIPTGQALALTANATDPDGTVASYAWDTDGDGNFNDGSTVTVQPSYAANGPVTVAVRVTDNSGATATATKSITVLNRAPTANFSQSPAAPLTQETITFTSTSSDPDGTIASYGWDLDNDGQFDDSTGPSAQGAFANNGTYTVKLRVTDDDGGTNEISKVVTVTNRPPAASFNYSPLTVNPFDTVTFTSTSTDSDGNVAAYAWDLDGDGQFDDATGPVVERRNAFRTVGAHTVRLRATDDDGGQNVATVEVFVGNRPPVSSFVYTPHNPLVNQTVNFFSTATDPDSTIQASGLEWDLNGDGVFDDATGGAVSRTFPSPGAYSVGLRVTDPDGESSIYTDTVNVSVPPPPAVVQDPGVSLISPFPVVRVAGRVYSGGTRLRMLSVNAPAGTTVTVRCSGKGCPFTSSRQSTASAGSRPATTIRIKRLEKRLLRSGVMVKIFITKPGAVGKFTSIKIRGRKSPLRVDRCLMPGVLKPVQCPS
jgi:PKD repeat protein